MAHAVVRDAVPTRRRHRRKPGQARQAVCDESLARRLNPSALYIGAHMLLGTRSRDIASSATTIARHARPRRGVAMSIADSAEIATGRTIPRIAARCVLRTASDIFVLSAGKMDRGFSRKAF